MKSFFKKGFTIVELLVVIAILIIVFAITLNALQKSREKQSLNNAVSEIITTIDKAHSQTLASVDSSEYGVHFASDTVTLFKGQVYSAISPSNEVVDILPPASITNISLTGGASELYFSRLWGKPSVAGSLTVSTSDFTRVVTIGPTGEISSN